MRIIHKTPLTAYFGFAEPLLVSAAQKLGLTELKSRILKNLSLSPKSGDPEHNLQLITCDEHEEFEDEEYSEAHDEEVEEFKQRAFDPQKVVLLLLAGLILASRHSKHFAQ